MEKRNVLAGDKCDFAAFATRAQRRRMRSNSCKRHQALSVVY